MTKVGGLSDKNKRGFCSPMDILLIYNTCTMYTGCGKNTFANPPFITLTEMWEGPIHQRKDIKTLIKCSTHIFFKQPIMENIYMGMNIQ